MSEETIQQVPQEENTCKKLTILVMVTLLFSIATFILTLVNTITGTGAPNAQAEAAAPKQDRNAVVISKQYDKGQSFEKALKTKKPMIVFFYTDWCGFCQRFAPTFHKVTKTKDIKKNFAVAYVNCDSPESRKHMEEFGVQGFPTVYVIDGDNKRTQLENGTFFTATTEQDLPKTIMGLIKK